MVKEQNNLFILNNLYNVRHLGGLQTKDGTQTKHYKYIRGSAKGDLTNDEKAYFYNLGTRVIVDLRYTNEITKTPSPLAGYKDMQYYHVDMMGEFWQMNNEGYVDLSELYVDLLDHSQDKIREVLKIFINHPTEGVYFHCTAGKDRTGVITMLMLDLIGVPHKTIIDNYSESYENNKDRPGYKKMPEEWRKFTYSEPEYMAKTLTYLYEKYGNSAQYLETIGLTATDIKTLEQTLLTNNITL